MINYKDFATKIKAQYPEYADSDDKELAKKIIEKYPEYKEKVSFLPKAATKEELAQRILEAKREEYAKMPWYDRALAGAGKIAYSSSIGLVKSLLGQGDEVRDTMGEFEQASQGDAATFLGGIGADLALTAIPVSKAGSLARGATNLGRYGKAAIGGLGEGLASASMHQLQNVGQGKDVSLGAAGLETGLSAALPVVGTAMSDFFKAGGKEVLRAASKPKDYLKRSINPPDYKYALDNKTVSYFGGPQKMYDKINEQITRNSGIKQAIGQESGVVVDYGQVLADARRNLSKNVGKKGGLSTDDYQLALKHEDDLVNTIIQTGQDLQADVANATTIRQFADGRSNFTDDIKKTITNESHYYKAVRDAIEDQIDSKVANSGMDKAKISQYLKAKQDLGKLMPLKNSTKDMLERKANTYQRIAIMNGIPTGIGATYGAMSAEENKGQNALKYMALGYGVGNLLSTPGGAKMLYDVGQGIGNQVLQTGLGQLGRSAAFAP